MPASAPPAQSSSSADLTVSPFIRPTFYRAWHKAIAAAGLEGFHFHDLRHTGSTLIGTHGATPAELMARNGWSSWQSASRYQHATQERDRALADRLSDTITGTQTQPLAQVVHLEAADRPR